MILYIAGSTSGAEQERDIVEIGLRHRLLSFAELGVWGDRSFAYWLSDEAPCPFFLDSGAFSAVTKGVTLDLGAYCQWIEDHERSLSAYASLDVFGDWKQTARNYAYMCDRGLTPIPVFHQGSPMHELKRLLSISDHLALGGQIGAHRGIKEPWLDNVFRVVSNYWPKKVHLFGVLGMWALERYPLYSADGSSPITAAGLGRLMTFKHGRIRSYDAIAYGKAMYDGDVLNGVAVPKYRNGSAIRGRRKINVQCFLDAQRYVTDLWAARGVTWEG